MRDVNLSIGAERKAFLNKNLKVQFTYETPIFVSLNIITIKQKIDGGNMRRPSKLSLLNVHFVILTMFQIQLWVYYYLSATKDMSSISNVLGAWTSRRCMVRQGITKYQYLIDFSRIHMLSPSFFKAHLVKLMPGYFLFSLILLPFWVKFPVKVLRKAKKSKCKHSKSPCSVVFESLSVSCRYTIYFQGQDWFGWWGSKIKQKAKLVVPAMAYRDWTPLLFRCQNKGAERRDFCWWWRSAISVRQPLFFELRTPFYYCYRGCVSSTLHTNALR